MSSSVAAKIKFMREDCFAMSEDGKCSALRATLCKRRECPFYKNRETFDSELMKYNGKTDVNIIIKEYVKASYGTG